MTTREKPVDRPVDDEIALTATDALHRDADVRHDRITLTVEDGWITLRGCADTLVERSMAEVTARYAPGVRGVTNLLEVAAQRARDGGRAHASHARSSRSEPRAAK